MPHHWRGADAIQETGKAHDNHLICAGAGRRELLRCTTATARRCARWLQVSVADEFSSGETTELPRLADWSTPPERTVRVFRIGEDRLLPCAGRGRRGAGGLHPRAAVVARRARQTLRLPLLLVSASPVVPRQQVLLALRQRRGACNAAAHRVPQLRRRSPQRSSWRDCRRDGWRERSCSRQQDARLAVGACRRVHRDWRVSEDTVRREVERRWGNMRARPAFLQEPARLSETLCGVLVHVDRSAHPHRPP